MSSTTNQEYTFNKYPTRLTTSQHQLELPRLVHQSATHSQCIVTKEPKYSKIVDPTSTPTQTPQSPTASRCWVDLTTKRPDPDSWYAEHIIKNVSRFNTSKALNYDYRDRKSTQNDPSSSHAAAAALSYIPLYIPNSQYSGLVLQTAHIYGSDEVLPAIRSQNASRRSRFPGSDFVAEIHRIPLSLYSTPYLGQEGKVEYLRLLKEHKLPVILNDPVDLDMANGRNIDPSAPQLTKLMADGDFVNASDIIPPPLFSQQFFDDNGKCSTDTFISLDKLMNFPQNIIPKQMNENENNEKFQIPTTTYVGTHYPTPSSNQYFFQVIFEQQLRMVVALTKSDDNIYWPTSSINPREDDIRFCQGKSKPGDTCRFGDFLVRITKVDLFEENDAVIARHVKVVHDPRHLRIGKPDFDWDTDLTTDNYIECCLVQYFDWIDMDVPSLKSFTSFYQIYTQLKYSLESQHNNSPLYYTRPIGCHCLAGIGRAGTFMSLDIILTHLNSIFARLGISLFPSSEIQVSQDVPKMSLENFSHLINPEMLLLVIPYVIIGLRHCRREMVQTLEQATFIARFISQFLNQTVDKYLKQ